MVGGVISVDLVAIVGKLTFQNPQQDNTHIDFHDSQTDTVTPYQTHSQTLLLTQLLWAFFSCVDIWVW